MAVESTLSPARRTLALIDLWSAKGYLTDFERGYLAGKLSALYVWVDEAMTPDEYRAAHERLEQLRQPAQVPA